MNHTTDEVTQCIEDPFLRWTIFTGAWLLLWRRGVSGSWENISHSPGIPFSVSLSSLGWTVRRQCCFRRHLLLLRLLRLLLFPRMARLVGLEGSQLPGVKDPVGIGVTAACRIRAKFLILGSWHAVASCATCLDTHRKRILPNPVSRAGEYHRCSI